jgi:hypothetical protein
MSSNIECIECPICMDEIKLGKNCVTTECGHCFHTNCLMTSVAHNGFGCPYCRTVMAEENIEEDDEDEYDEEDEEDEDDDNNDSALRGFRFFFNNIYGNEHDDIDNAAEDVMNAYLEAELEEQQNIPSAAFVTQKLVEQGVTMEQLVKSLLYSNHEEYENDQDAELIDDVLFGKARIIISNYSPQVENLQVVTAPGVAMTPIASSPGIDESAQPKIHNVAQRRRNEPLV